MKIDSVTFFSDNLGVNASEHLRVLAPLTYAGIDVKKEIASEFFDEIKIKNTDLVVIQRNFPRHTKFFLDLISSAKELGKPVVLDLDDDFLNLPTNHPDRLSGVFTDSLLSLLYAITAVDAVTVTTQALYDGVAEFTKSVYLLPNYLDDAIWKIRPLPQGKQDEKVKLIYIAGQSHYPDLESIKPALLNISNKYGSKVEFIFYGVEHPILKLLNNVVHIPTKTYEYKKFAEDVDNLDAAIGIAPLVHNQFNDSKSALKFLEYSAIGLAGVYSNVTAYNQTVEAGVTGLLSASQDEWEKNISLLIDDDEYRRAIATNAQQEVQANWLLRDHAHKWAETYDQIYNDFGKSQIGISPVVQETIKSIAIQTEEKAVRDDENLEDLKGSIKQLKQETEKLSTDLVTARNEVVDCKQETEKLTLELAKTRNEVVDYATSTSWEITRPLRKIMKKIRRS